LTQLKGKRKRGAAAFLVVAYAGGDSAILLLRAVLSLSVAGILFPILCVEKVHHLAGRAGSPENSFDIARVCDVILLIEKALSSGRVSRVEIVVNAILPAETFFLLLL